jgi:hypothetical protein
MRLTILARAALIGAVCTLAACTKGGRSDYVRDGDTGAAAPATMTDASHPTTTRDSTDAVGQRTGTPEAAGDRLGQHGAAANPNAAPAAAGAMTPAPVKKP